MLQIHHMQRNNWYGRYNLQSELCMHVELHRYSQHGWSIKHCTYMICLSYLWTIKRTHSYINLWLYTILPQYYTNVFLSVRGRSLAKLRVFLYCFVSSSGGFTPTYNLSLSKEKTSTLQWDGRIYVKWVLTKYWDGVSTNPCSNMKTIRS